MADLEATVAARNAYAALSSAATLAYNDTVTAALLAYDAASKAAYAGYATASNANQTAFSLGSQASAGAYGIAAASTSNAQSKAVTDAAFAAWAEDEELDAAAKSLLSKGQKAAENADYIAWATEQASLQNAYVNAELTTTQEYIAAETNAYNNYAAAVTALQSTYDAQMLAYHTELAGLDNGTTTVETPPVMMTMMMQGGQNSEGDNSQPSHPSCTCNSTGTCFRCLFGDYNPGMPWQYGDQQADPMDEYWRWVRGNANGIVIHRDGLTTKTLALSNVFSKLKSSLKTTVRVELAQNPGISKDEINKLIKKLSHEHFLNNPLDSSIATKTGEGDWLAYTVRGPNNSSPAKRVLLDLTVYAFNLKDKTTQTHPPILAKDRVNELSSALGSFRYTYSIVSIDPEKMTMTVRFKAYNKVSNESGTGGMLEDVDEGSILHQIFVWTETINVALK